MTDELSIVGGSILSESSKRLTPIPKLLSLADSLKLSGVYLLAKTLTDLLRKDDVTHVDVVSYVTTFPALEELGFLHHRPTPGKGRPHESGTGRNYNTKRTGRELLAARAISLNARF